MASLNLCVDDEHISGHLSACSSYDTCNAQFTLAHAVVMTKCPALLTDDHGFEAAVAIWWGIFGSSRKILNRCIRTNITIDYACKYFDIKTNKFR